ncbi:hypothetical protein RRSWK_06771 [Rhodopirellula sp. SWK7]|nr:hypothetical protein RRSWK_06771 [Rhodopirellula sp. SWK7]
MDWGITHQLIIPIADAELAKIFNFSQKAAIDRKTPQDASVNRRQCDVGGAALNCEFTRVAV